MITEKSGSTEAPVELVVWSFATRELLNNPGKDYETMLYCMVLIDYFISLSQQILLQVTRIHINMISL